MWESWTYKKFCQLNSGPSSNSRGQYQGGRGHYQNSRGEYRTNYGNYRGNYNGQQGNYARIYGGGYRGEQQDRNIGECNSFNVEVNTSTINQEDSLDSNTIKWLLDSGCTDHIIHNDKYFSTLHEPMNVKVGDGWILLATKIGCVKAFFPVYDKQVCITLNNVFYVNGMEANLISYSKVADKNKILSYRNMLKLYNPKNELIATANKKSNLYEMTSFIEKESIITYPDDASVSMWSEDKSKVTLKEKWHRMLGHINFKII